MTQREQVIEALQKCGGFATFAELYRKVDTSQWGDICDYDHLHKYYMRTMALRGMSL
jgi:hypothetical protein